jgi:putative hydrolase
VTTPDDPDRDDEDGANPFAGLPMFGDIARMMQGQGPLNWDIARQFAAMAASGGVSEANVDPKVRMELDELARIADMQVQQVTDLPTAVEGRPVSLVVMTPGTWAQRTLDDYRPLVTELATSLGQRGDMGELDDDATDPMAQMFAGLSKMMAPSMLGMAVGSMVGHLAARAFGQYDLPIPRPRGSELLIVPQTIDAFAEDWSLPLDELRLWVCLQEITAHAVLAVPHLRDALESQVRRHVAGFRPDASAIADRLGAVDLGDADALQALQKTLGDPEVLLGAVQTPEQRAALPYLDALVSVIVGYVDHAVDTGAAHLLGNPGQVAEAVRRRRIESSPDDVFVSKLLGLTLSRQQVDRGRAFVAGVVERAGDDGLRQLFESADSIPTPNEVDAPGLWLARLELE